MKHCDFPSLGRVFRCALCAVLLAGCTGGVLTDNAATSLNTITAPADTPYTMRTAAELIGGPQAEGRVGDVLLTNDVIRVVIRAPGKYPGVGSFGGNIIDADRVRVQGGRDQFGVMLPVVNMEWTLNGTEILAFQAFDLTRFLDGEIAPLTARLPDGTPPVIVVRQVIDTYEYLDLDFLEQAAKVIAGQEVSYDSRFDDITAPFASFDLRSLRTTVYTEYRLAPGSRHVTIRTTFFNDGEKPVKLPVGDFVNGSGALQLLIPGQGFSPAIGDQALAATPAVIFAGQPGVDVSYGYFYDPREFVDGKGNPQAAASVTFSGVTGVLLGESFSKIFPLGSKQRAQINFTVPANSSRTITRYFVVGDGSAGSVWDEGLRALEIPAQAVSGRVVDARGVGVAEAVVAVQNGDGKTVVTWRTDTQGRFSGYLASGDDPVTALFGRGDYTFLVDKTGYRQKGIDQAGTCTPSSVNMDAADTGIDVTCVLGDVGVVQFAGPMRDAATNAPLVTRLTILGADPSPDRGVPGVFRDTVVNERPYGVVQLHYLNARGGIDVGDGRSLTLEPGDYLFAWSRGMEYELRVEPVHVPTYGVLTLTPGTLTRVLPTPGFVAADFHIHASPSPDSAVSTGFRALAAAGEGLDVLHSSDHDFLFDYAPVVADLVARGLVPDGTLATIVGDEITPNHLGHIHAFPLRADPDKPAGGALDWSASPDDRIDPSPDLTMTVQEILDHARTMADGAELVLQMNHVSDVPTSLTSLTGMVTSPAYRERDGVELFAFFSDPMMTRLPYDGAAELPVPWRTSPQAGVSFTALEVSIGPELHGNELLETGLPQWFNLLNAGLLVTATANSDSHTDHRPIGLPRNFILSDVDPADGLGTAFAGFSADAYARAINEHRVVVSAGPYVQITARSPDGGFAEVGGSLRAHEATVRVEVTAPSWAWFDTIEIFANTEPVPADDDGVTVGEGAAAHADSFFAPYHRPRFVYQPVKKFRLRDGTLKDWTEKHGVIRAVVEVPMTFDTDTWVVAFARGTPTTPGFRPLFPLAVHNRAKAGEQPTTAHQTLAEYYADPLMAVPAWGFTNPIFIDVDGDTNNDGNPFEALYIKRGWSPLGQ